MSIMVMHNRLGMVDSHILALDRIASEYDEKLQVGRHRDSGEWALFILLERPREPYPVFLLGEPLPTKDALLQRLRKTDSQRHDIRKQINDANVAWEAEIDRRTKEKIGQAAEVAEFIGRKEGVYQETVSRRKIVRQ